MISYIILLRNHNSVVFSVLTILCETVHSLCPCIGTDLDITVQHVKSKCLVDTMRTFEMRKFPFSRMPFLPCHSSLLCGHSIGHITHLAHPSVCPVWAVTRKQKKQRKIKIGMIFPHGTSKWNGDFQLKRSKFKNLKKLVHI